MVWNPNRKSSIHNNVICPYTNLLYKTGKIEVETFCGRHHVACSEILHFTPLGLSLYSNRECFWRWVRFFSTLYRRVMYRFFIVFCKPTSYWSQAVKGWCSKQRVRRRVQRLSWNQRSGRCPEYRNSSACFSRSIWRWNGSSYLSYRPWTSRPGGGEQPRGPCTNVREGDGHLEFYQG